MTPDGDIDGGDWLALYMKAMVGVTFAVLTMGVYDGLRLVAREDGDYGK